MLTATALVQDLLRVRHIDIDTLIVNALFKEGHYREEGIKGRQAHDLVLYGAAPHTEARLVLDFSNRRQNHAK